MGREAARLLFQLFPGTWEIRQLPGNEAATRFWRAVLPAGYVETMTPQGPVQRFRV